MICLIKRGLQITSRFQSWKIYFEQNSKLEDVREIRMMKWAKQLYTKDYGTQTIVCLLGSEVDRMCCIDQGAWYTGIFDLIVGTH